MGCHNPWLRVTSFSFNTYVQANHLLVSPGLANSYGGLIHQQKLVVMNLTPLLQTLKVRSCGWLFGFRSKRI